MNSYWEARLHIGGALLLGALARILRRATVRDGILFGLGLAILANSRPYEGLVFSLPALLVLLRWLFKEKAATPQLISRLRTVALPLVGVLLLAATFMGFYNLRLTGHAMLFPHTLNVRTYHSAPMFLFQSMRPMLRHNNQQFEDFTTDGSARSMTARGKASGAFLWLKSVRFFRPTLGGARFSFYRRCLRSP
jgi:hypothetical protein